MNQERRKLLVGAAAVAAGFTFTTLSDGLLQKTTAEEVTGRSPESDKRYVFVVDLDKCDGCGKCTESCQAEMHVPPASGGQVQFAGKQAWLQVFDIGDGVFMPVLCQNCQNAPCAKICPVGATFYSEDHIVLIDQDRCIGCKYCVVACPYERRFFNWFDPPVIPSEANVPYSPDYNIPHRKGVAEKCIWCRHRVNEGKVPACVDACTKSGMKALWFGDAAQGEVSNGKETVALSELIWRRGAYRLKDELGTLPQVLYLPPRG